MKVATLALALVAGVITAVLSQMLTGWWLDSGRGVAFMMALLCALSMGFVWLDRKAPLALWVGMMNATIVILFMTGPGNIFPIVIVFATVLSALAIVPGWILWMLATGAQSAVRAQIRRHLG